MNEIPEIFAPSAEEAERMAAFTQRLEDTRETFALAKAQHESRAGIIGSVVGELGLRRATKGAQREGLVVMNGDVIVPQVVPLAYLKALDDDF